MKKVLITVLIQGKKQLEGEALLYEELKSAGISNDKVHISHDQYSIFITWNHRNSLTTTTSIDWTKSSIQIDMDANGKIKYTWS